MDTVMPYIKSSQRRYVLERARALAEDAGELNFQLTALIQAYAKSKGHSYQTFNDISGAMTECLAEFRRRVIAPYEDKKIVENGDVY